MPCRAEPGRRTRATASAVVVERARRPRRRGSRSPYASSSPELPVARARRRGRAPGGRASTSRPRRRGVARWAPRRSAARPLGRRRAAARASLRSTGAAASAPSAGRGLRARRRLAAPAWPAVFGLGAARRLGVGVGRRADSRSRLVEALLDHLQRQEVVLLLVQDPPQARHVGLVELPVARRGALGVDEALALEEADLRDRDVGELVAQHAEHLADREVPRPRVRRVVIGASASCVILDAAHEQDEHEPADLELVEVAQRGGRRPARGHVGAVQRAGVGDLDSRRRTRSITAWRRETVMSSRKMSESGWRPSVVSVAFEQVPAARVGPPPDDDHAQAGGQLGERRAELVVELDPVLDGGDRDRGLARWCRATPRTRSRSWRRASLSMAAAPADHDMRVVPPDGRTKAPWTSTEVHARRRRPPDPGRTRRRARRRTRRRRPDPRPRGRPAPRAGSG